MPRPHRCVFIVGVTVVHERFEISFVEPDRDHHVRAARFMVLERLARRDTAMGDACERGYGVGKAHGLASVSRSQRGVVSWVREKLTAMEKAPRRDVTSIREVVGEKGGVILVHVLSCGCFVTRRRPAKTAPCLACFALSKSDGDSSIVKLLKSEMFEEHAHPGRTAEELAYRKGWNDRARDLIRRLFT